MIRCLLVWFAMVACVANGQFVQKNVKVERLHNIYFYNSQEGFAAGAGSDLSRTTDGGETWTKIKFTSQDSIAYISQINHQFFFTSPLTGFAATFSLFTAGGAIMKTNDGGITWQLVFIDTPLEEPINLTGYESIFFLDANNGFAVGAEGRRIVTTDGGNTWVRNDLPFKVNYTNIFFVDGQTGFIAGGGHLLKTTNGGASWNSVSNHTFKSLFFTNTLNGHAISDNDQIFRTSDGGITWTAYPNYYTNGGAYDITFINDQTGYVAGAFQDGKNLLKTTNGGLLWEPISQQFESPLLKVIFFDESTGYVGGNNFTQSYVGKTATGTGLTMPVPYFSYQAGTACVGASINFINHGIETYQHEWYVNNVLVSNSYHFNFTFNNGGNYTIKLTTSHNGYTRSYSQNVGVSSPITFDNLILSHLPPLCQGSTFYLSVLNPNSWLEYELWAGDTFLKRSPYYNASFEVLHGLDSTTMLTVKGVPREDLCATPPSKTIEVIVVPPVTVIETEVLPGSVVCKDQSFDIVAHHSQPNVKYYLYDGQYAGELYKYGNGGDLVFDMVSWQEKRPFHLSVSSPCQVLDTLIIVSESTVKSKFKIGNQGLFLDETLDLTNESTATQFVWNFGEGAVPATSTDQSPGFVQYTTAGTKRIKLSVRDNFGCEHQTDTTLFVAARSAALGIAPCSENVTSGSLEKYFPVDSKTDLQGNIYQTGYFLHGKQVYCDHGCFSAMYLHKYDPQGNLIWKKEVDPTLGLGSIDYNGSFGRGVTTDLEGNVYVIFDFIGYNVTLDNQTIGYEGRLALAGRYRSQSAVVKYSPEGEFLWSIVGHETEISNSNRNGFGAVDLEVDPAGDLYFIVGAFENITTTASLSFSNGFELYPSTQSFPPYGNLCLVKVSSAGAYLNHWGFNAPASIYYNGVNSGAQIIETARPRITIDKNSKVFIAGLYYGVDPNFPYRFGSHMLTEPTPGIFIAGFKNGVWENAFVGPRIKGPGLNYSQNFVDQIICDANSETIYFSGHNNIYATEVYNYGHNPDSVILIDDFNIFNKANSFITAWSYSGTKQWINFQNRISTSGIQFDSETNKLTAVGTLDAFGTFDALDPNPKGFRSNGKRDPVVAQLDAQTGKLIAAQVYGNESDEMTFSNGEMRCGIVSLIGMEGGNTSHRKLSLVGSCNPQAPTLMADELLKVCLFDSVQAHASGAYRYYWSPADQVDNPSSASPWLKPQVQQPQYGDDVVHYSVLGISEQGCVSSKEVEVRIEKPYMSVDYPIEENTKKVTFTVLYPAEGIMNWEFSDGQTDVGQTVEHTFPNPGVYQATVSTTNSCGPISTTLEEVRVICQPLEFQSGGWTNYMTGQEVRFNVYAELVKSWLWDFGDGTTSTDPITTHVYAQRDTFQVTITGTNECDTISSTFPVDITCKPIKAGFTYTAQNLTVDFHNNTTYAFWNLWDYGDGTATSNAYSEIHQYQNPGTYTVCVSGTSDCSSDTVCQQITVSCDDEILPDIRWYTNKRTLTIDNATLGLDSAAWNFGDGSVSYEFSPIHEYSGSGTYNVCVQLFDECGHTTTVCKTVDINCPAPDASFSSSSGSLNVSFTSTTGQGTYQWDFGDGQSSAAAQPTHTYINPGTYSVCLIATNECGSTTLCQPIVVTCQQAITPNFNLNSNNRLLTISNNTVGSESVSWDFGDDQVSTSTSPSHTYANTGSYTVCGTFKNKCQQEVVCRQVTIVCNGPVAAFISTANQRVVSFANTSTDGTLYSWNFGDGQSSAAAQLSHTYTAPGTYNVCLTAQNECGTSTTCHEIVVTCAHGIVPNMTLSSNNLTLNSINTSTGAISYEWNFGDGQFSTLKSPIHQYQEEGTYSVCLKMTNLCGTVTVCKEVSISCPNPSAAFEFSANLEELTFTNNSTNAVTYSWNFGDGEESEATNPTHSYNDAGAYTICLTATNGCNEESESCQEFTLAITGVEGPSINELTIYPNPFHDSFTLEFENQHVKTISIYNLLGVQIKTVVPNSSMERYTVTMQDQSSGLYIVVIKTPTGSRSFKILKND